MNSNCALSKKHCTPCKEGVLPLKGEALAKLFQELSRGWSVIDEHHLEKSYPFKNFREGLAFTNKVGALAEQERHHPDILLSYSCVKILLWTHKIDGLTESDFIFAARCEAL